MKLNRKHTLFLNILASFLIAYLTIKLIVYLVFSGIGSYFEIETVLKNFNPYSPTIGESNNWTQVSVLSLYSLFVAVPLLLGFISYVIFIIIRYRISGYKILPAMFYYTAANLILGGIVAGSVTETNFFHFLNWIYCPDWLNIVIIFIVINISIILGFIFMPDFVVISTSENILLKSYRKKFLLRFLVKPVIAGLAILFLLNINNIRLYEIIEAVFLILPFATIPFIRKRYVRPIAEKQKTRLPLGLLYIIAVVFIAGYIIIRYI